MSKKPEDLQSIKQLLIDAPLYKTYALPDDLLLVTQLFGRAGAIKFDAHCPICRQSTTWTLKGLSVPNGDPWRDIKTYYGHDTAKLICGRSDTHVLRFFLRITDMTVQKVGQFPSLASLANDEFARYRKTMTDQDAEEFYKGVGLAAHGAGIGSFAYLRRVFERLVQRRYDEFKSAEGWQDEVFNRLDMREKVAFLKGHLPQFLVDNARIYSILSAGIHGLSDEECLDAFEMLKLSIMTIADDDIQKQADLKSRLDLTKAISSFDAKKGQTEA